MLTANELARRAAALVAAGLMPVIPVARRVEAKPTPPVERKPVPTAVTKLPPDSAPALRPKPLQALVGESIFRSRFVPAKSGGLMAELRIGGRTVFPERGPDVRNDGTVWNFAISGENHKQTVYFARLIEPATGKDASPQACTFVKDPKGRIIAVGAALKAIKSPPPERECKVVHQGLSYSRSRRVKVYKAVINGPKRWNYTSVREDWLSEAIYYDDECNGCHDCGFVCEECTCCQSCGCESKESDCDNDNPWNLPDHIVNCHACGFEDCRCDGTASDWVPARTTLRRW